MKIFDFIDIKYDNIFMKKNIVHLISLSIMHLLVDFMCVATLYHFDYQCGHKDNQVIVATVFLTYNCLAFLLQPLFGLLVDKFGSWNKYGFNKGLVMASVLTTLLGAFLVLLEIHFANQIWFFIPGTILLGMGNALFHVTGGKVSLKMSNKATPGGIFVSTGAIGLGIAAILHGEVEYFYYFIAPALLIVCSLIHVFTPVEISDKPFEPHEHKSIKAYVLVIIVLCVAVAVRSFVGFYYEKPEGMDTLQAIMLLATMACLGKALGGLIMDLLGPYVLIGLSTVSGIILSFFLKNQVVVYFFIFSFNLLMPLTLDALRRLFPNKEGFAFGLAAAFLIPGYLTAMLLQGQGIQIVVLPIICLLTGGVLIPVYLINEHHINI